MKMSKIVKKIPKKWLAAGLAGASALAAIAIALSSTLAATPVDVKFTNPNPSFPVIEVGETVPHAMRGALSINPSGSIEIVPGVGSARCMAKSKAAGSGKLSITSKKFVWEQDYQSINSDDIGGYYFNKGVVGYAPKNATSYQLSYSIYPAGGGTLVGTASDREKISWSSGSSEIGTINSDGLVQLKANGIPTLIGSFTDCWGDPHTVVFALYIGDTSGDADLTALAEVVALAKAELAKPEDYTPESLAALQLLVDSAEAILGTADPEVLTVAAATQSLYDGIYELVDVSELKALIAAAAGPFSNPEAYTEVSLLAYQVAVEAGEVVLNSTAPTQAAVDAAAQTIRNKRRVLVNIEELKVAIAEAESALEEAEEALEDSWMYTGKSVEELEAAIEFGKLCLGEGIPADIDDATQAIRDMIDSLADTTQLKLAIAEGETALLTASGVYTVKSIALLQSWINTGKERLEDGTIVTVNVATQSIRRSIMRLVNIEELKAAIAVAEAAIEDAENALDGSGNYTGKSVEDLRKAIADGHALIEEGYPDDIDDASQLIRDLTSKLVDISALKEAIRDGETALLRWAEYTTVTVNALKSAIAVGNDQLLNGEDRNEIDEATQDIRYAIAALVESPAFTFVLDTTIAASNSAFGTSARNVILQVGADAGNDYSVIWGDGETTVHTGSTKPNHTYKTAGTYTVKIAGVLFGGIKFVSTNTGTLAEGESVAATGTIYGETRLKSVSTPLLPTKNTNLSGVFAGCTNLTSIPSDILINQPEATTVSWLFYNCKNLAGTIPGDLFRNNPELTDFTRTFSECEKLSGAIPSGLFENNENALLFNRTFRTCSKLTSIPAGLFSNNRNVTSFLGTFVTCNAITAVPAGLFDNNNEVTTFFAVFYHSTGIKTIPTTIFDQHKKVTTLQSAFDGCTAITSALPDFWNGTATKFPLLKTTTYCFYACTKASNYSSVPAAWR